MDNFVHVDICWYMILLLRSFYFLNCFIPYCNVILRRIKVMTHLQVQFYFLHILLLLHIIGWVEHRIFHCIHTIHIKSNNSRNKSSSGSTFRCTIFFKYIISFQIVNILQLGLSYQVFCSVMIIASSHIPKRIDRKRGTVSYITINLLQKNTRHTIVV